MTVELLTEHHLDYVSLKRGNTGSSESTLVKMPHCWKSHVAAQNTVKAVLSGHLTLDKTKVFMVNCNLMKVESIAE